MESRKLKLRKDMLDLLEAARINGNRSSYIKIAIMYGLYRAMGGEKALALPPYCDRAIKAAYELSRLLLSDKKNNSKYINIALRKMADVLNIASVDIRDRNKCTDISLTIMGSGSRTYNMHLLFEEEQIIKNMIYIVGFGLSLVYQIDLETLLDYMEIIPMNLRGDNCE